MLIEYYPSESYVHKLDVRTKALGFFAITIISFVFLSPIINLLIVFCICVILFTIRTPFSGIKKLLKPLLPIFILMLLITGFTYPASNFTSEANQKTLFSVGTIPFTLGGFLYGVTLVLRILIMVITSTIVTYTTPIEDILQLLKKIKIPHQFAFIIATGIRFIPTMQKKSEMIQEAQKARGAEIGKGGFIKSIGSYITVLIPLIVDSLRMSDNLAIAMLNRGFGAMKTTTDLNEIKMRTRDYLICFNEVILIAIAFWIRSKNIGVL